jgi:mono/diheme cytochrome c family protein
LKLAGNQVLLFRKSAHKKAPKMGIHKRKKRIRFEEVPRLKKWMMPAVIAACCLYAIVLMTFSLVQREGPAPPPPGAPVSPGTPASPGAPTGTVDEAAAMSLYKSNCLACHGDQLQGQIGPALTHVGASMSQDQITTQIQNGGGGMPPFKGTLSDDQIATLAAWLAAKK